jgi:hypothetical protein
MADMLRITPQTPLLPLINYLLYFKLWLAFAKHLNIVLTTDSYAMLIIKGV